jgi:hypothetical protein
MRRARKAHEFRRARKAHEDANPSSCIFFDEFRRLFFANHEQGRLNRYEPSLEEQVIGRRQRQIRIRTVVAGTRGKREVELSLLLVFLFIIFLFFIAFVLAVGSLLFSVLGFVISTFRIVLFVRNSELQVKERPVVVVIFVSLRRIMSHRGDDCGGTGSSRRVSATSTSAVNTAAPPPVLEQAESSSHQK